MLELEFDLAHRDSRKIWQFWQYRYLIVLCYYFNMFGQTRYLVFLSLGIHPGPEKLQLLQHSLWWLKSNVLKTIFQQLTFTVNTYR